MKTPTERVREPGRGEVGVRGARCGHLARLFSPNSQWESDENPGQEWETPSRVKFEGLFVSSHRRNACQPVLVPVKTVGPKVSSAAKRRLRMTTAAIVGPSRTAPCFSILPSHSRANHLLVLCTARGGTPSGF
jgi:hypothetical protein